jgi:predicted transposase/invertase (TIGR01784 family)
MQILHHRFYGRRALYYLANEYVGQIEAKDNYTKLNTAIGIHFLDFAYFEDDRYRHHFVFKDIEDNLMPTALDGMQLYFIEMPKFRKDWPEVSTDLERLVAFLKGAEKLDPSKLPSQILEEPALLKAISQLERMGMDKEQRSIYESEVKRRMVDSIQLESAREDGVQQGMQHVILRMLHRMLPDISETTIARLEVLDSEALDDLSAALFDFHSLEDVEGWLAGR